MAARSTKYSKAFQKRLDDEASMDPSGFSLAQPFRAVESRCKRRWYDYQRLRTCLRGSARFSRASPPPLLPGASARARRPCRDAGCH